MQAFRFNKKVEKNGEIFLSGLPCKQGQDVELILLFENTVSAKQNSQSTAKDLLNSDLIGLWENRDDIEDSETAYLKRNEKTPRVEPQSKE